jgi:hypothetical protein
MSNDQIPMTNILATEAQSSQSKEIEKKLCDLCGSVAQIH